MIRLGVRSFGIAGAPEGFPGHGNWPKDPRMRSLVGGREAIFNALRADYPPLALRRLDLYAATALLAAKLALAGLCPHPAGALPQTLRWGFAPDPTGGNDSPRTPSMGFASCSGAISAGTRREAIAGCRGIIPLPGVQGAAPPGGIQGQRPWQGSPEGAEPPLGLVVCTGRGPVPAINAFADSYMDFGLEGASPTAFSQTVHNVAASTISMFLGILGPTLTASQPGLGGSGALCTVRSWLDLGLVQAVLFGAVDDYGAFSTVLGESSNRTDHSSRSANREPHGPLAVFAVLSGADVGGELLTVEADPFSPARANAQAAQTQCPVDILSGFLCALAVGREETILEETYGGAAALLSVRLNAGGGARL